MKSITVHKIDDELAKAISGMARKTGLSQNKVIKRLLRKALGLDEEKRTIDLSGVAGTWTEEDLREFKENTADLERIDEEEW